MASNITLSAGVRQNLLALQNTASLMSDTQNRLATGKKVNSALDNPGSFFTSQALNNRAGDLNSLLDSIGQAQQTLKAADTGLTSLTKLVESAKSIAKQAQQAPQPGSTTYSSFSVSGDPTNEALGSFTASGFSAPSANGSVAFTVTVNGTARSLTANVTSGDAVADVAGAMQAAIDADTGAGGAAGHATVTTSGGFLKVDALDADTDISITANARTAEIGLTADASTDRNVNSTSLLDNIGSSGQTLSVAVNGGATQVITFGTGAGQVSTLSELSTKIGTLNGVTGSASNSAVTFNVGTSNSSQNSLSLSSSNSSLASALGLSQNSTTQGTATVGSPNSTRASLESDYNNVLSQIDALVVDASYNGVNLLNGDDFKVTFNESGSSSLTITGVSFNTGGLGLSSIGSGHFQSDGNIDSEIAKLDGALSTLRNQASKFGSNLTTVQTRQDFTKNMINTLQTGADNLVLADTNAEGANLLALQTRQQLSSTALSLSAQADQAVLRLF